MFEDKNQWVFKKWVYEKWEVEDRNKRIFKKCVFEEDGHWTNTPLPHTLPSGDENFMVGRRDKKVALRAAFLSTSFLRGLYLDNMPRIMQVWERSGGRWLSGLGELRAPVDQARIPRM